MGKEVYDLRGRQALIGRLLRFYKEAYVHMLFYRILIIFSFLAAAVFSLSLLFDSFGPIFRTVFLLLWIFFTPQVFETSKGVSVIATEGFIFGNLNKSYMVTAEKYEKHALAPIYKVAPYAALSLWAAGFIALALLWFA